MSATGEVIHILQVIDPGGNCLFQRKFEPPLDIEEGQCLMYHKFLPQTVMKLDRLVQIQEGIEHDITIAHVKSNQQLMEESQER